MKYDIKLYSNERLMACNRKSTITWRSTVMRAMSSSTSGWASEPRGWSSWWSVVDRPASGISTVTENGNAETDQPFTSMFINVRTEIKIFFLSTLGEVPTGFCLLIELSLQDHRISDYRSDSDSDRSPSHLFADSLVFSLFLAVCQGSHNWTRTLQRPIIEK